MNESEFCQTLAERARQIGIRVDPPEQRRMFIHFQLLQHWNRRINLTGLSDPDEILTTHFIDSLSLADLADAGARVLDIGSGAGFPGLPLAVIRRDLTIVLSEAHAKKREFQEQAIRLLGVDRVSVISRSNEHEDDPHLRGTFHVVVTRALGGFDRILAAALPFLRPDGRILAMKGPQVFAELATHAEEIEREGFAARVVRETLLPDSGKKRLVVALERAEDGDAA